MAITLREINTKVDVLKERVSCIEKELDCDAHKEAIDTLKIDNLSMRNVILPNFKKEVMEQVNNIVTDIKEDVKSIKDKISKQTAFFIGGCIITPFAILIINRYGPIVLKTIGW